MKLNKVIHIIGMILTIAGMAFFLFSSFKIIGERELVSLIYVGLLVSFSSSLMITSTIRNKSVEIEELKKEIENLKIRVGEKV